MVSRENDHPVAKRVKLGRRPGENATADHILDCAEGEFATTGYDGTSLKVIADRAKVNPALVRYYFGSKLGLFTAIFKRRGHQLAAERIRRLDELEAGGHAPSLEEVVRAFLIPAIAIKREGSGGMAYLRLQARLQNEPHHLSESLRYEVYDQSTRRYIDALHRSLPSLGRDAIYWRMVLLIGAYFYVISGTSRIEVYSEGACTIDDDQELLRQMTSFFVAGLQGPMLS